VFHIELVTLQVAEACSALPPNTTIHLGFPLLLNSGKSILYTHLTEFTFNGSSTDEPMKAGAYLADNLLDPETATSQEPLDCAFSRVYGRETMFQLLEKPGNEHRLRRFGAAMHGASTVNSLGMFLTGKFNFSPSVEFPSQWR
jgi:hypothetical protein